jgi:micrococcal nuclease
MSSSLKMVYFLALSFIIIPAMAIAGQYKVIRVIDGDTILIRYNGKYEKVRLICVNPPKSVHPDEKQNMTMAEVAFRYTQKQLTGKYVDLEFESWIRGRYGVLLAYVFVDGKNINLDLVRKGLSPYFIKYGRSQKYDAEFRSAQKLARKEKLNIWDDRERTKK